MFVRNNFHQFHSEVDPEIQCYYGHLLDEDSVYLFGRLEVVQEKDSHLGSDEYKGLIIGYQGGKGIP